MGGVKRRKMIARLKRRIDAFNEHGEWPKRNNPGKEGGPTTGHIMHKPGGKR